MDNMIISLNCVIPVFIAIACGYFIRVKKIIPEGFHSYLSSLCFGVMLPLLLFRNAYVADLEKALSKELINFLICETICIFAVGAVKIYAQNYLQAPAE